MATVWDGAMRPVREARGFRGEIPRGPGGFRFPFYSSVTQPSEAVLTFLIYLYSVPWVTL